MAVRVDQVLVPLDHSAGRLAVLDFAAAVARGVGASLTLFHVYWPSNSMVSVVPGTSAQEETHAVRERGATLLAHAEEQLRAQGVSVVSTELRRAPSPSMAIIKHAVDFGLIVMGTHARTGVPRVILGSVTEQVLRHASCPVLAVHLPPE